MKYDPAKHHRRSIRLKNYDYSQAGAYFITVCTSRRQCLFGEISDGKMQLSEFGSLVEAVWLALPTHHAYIQLDCYVIMPNHVHGILLLTDRGRGEASAATVLATSSPLRADASPLRPIGTKSGSLSAVIQNFKSISARRINTVRGVSQPPVWQRNFHEHIIRNGRDLVATRDYIRNNPLQRKLNKENPQNSANFK